MVKKIVTGANLGFWSWLYQKISAVVMVLTFFMFIGMVIYLNNQSEVNYTVWQKFFHCIYVKLVFQVFFMSLVIHGWIGMKDVWMDYIKCNIVKLCLYTFTLIYLFSVCLYSLKIIWF